MIIFTSERLRQISSRYANWEKREHFKDLMTFVHSDAEPKIACIYGLRRTGKTVLGLQVLAEIGDYDQSSYILCQKQDSMQDIYTFLKGNPHISHLFLDEITAINDFADNANGLSDTYALYGVKIMISGTDSLGFRIASQHSLYDRMTMFHTSYISYPEHHRLMKGDLLDYIRSGGILGHGDEFLNSEECAVYAKTAICENIQNSLEHWRDGKAFGILSGLYDRNELTTYIQRLMDSLNRVFLTKTLQGKWMPQAWKLYRSSEDAKVMEQIRQRIAERLGVMDTLNSPPTRKALDQLEAYLKALDVIAVHDADGFREVFFTQPGMRYSHLDVLSSLLQFEKLQRNEKNEAFHIMQMAFEGHLLEDVVFFHMLKDTKIREEYEVHKYRNPETFAEVDMLLVNKKTDSIFLFEVKRTEFPKSNAVRHLLNPDVCSDIEKEFSGKIMGKSVLYMGKEQYINDSVIFLPAEEFLLDIQASIEKISKNHKHFLHEQSIRLFYESHSGNDIQNESIREIWQKYLPQIAGIVMKIATERSREEAFIHEMRKRLREKGYPDADVNQALREGIDGNSWSGGAPNVIKIGLDSSCHSKIEV